MAVFYLLPPSRGELIELAIVLIHLLELVLFFAGVMRYRDLTPVEDHERSSQASQARPLRSALFDR